MPSDSNHPRDKGKRYALVDHANSFHRPVSDLQSSPLKPPGPTSKIALGQSSMLNAPHRCACSPASASTSQAPEPTVRRSQTHTIAVASTSALKYLLSSRDALVQKARRVGSADRTIEPQTRLRAAAVTALATGAWADLDLPHHAGQDASWPPRVLHARSRHSQACRAATEAAQLGKGSREAAELLVEGRRTVMNTVCATAIQAAWRGWHARKGRHCDRQARVRSTKSCVHYAFPGDDSSMILVDLYSEADGSPTKACLSTLSGLNNPPKECDVRPLNVTSRRQKQSKLFKRQGEAHATKKAHTAQRRQDSRVQNPCSSPQCVLM
eukprot:TRINITY_DN2203_c0_g2_i1.p1 TRINITY_DN2203_c0_g2~~TRINITY_DN2203_c0_g2_i1.p1  ORF type:complete len:325 (+),score=-3.26 TRINITY_DN2203_c0_g2_i1:310-1284(+)